MTRVMLLGAWGNIELRDCVTFTEVMQSRHGTGANIIIVCTLAASRSHLGVTIIEVVTGVK